MSDIFTKQKRSDVMSRIRSTGNKGTELRLIQIFRAHGIRGWRRGCVVRGRKTEDRGRGKAFSVRPDFVFQKLPPSPGLRRTGKIALFVDGCFWHGCPQHATWPRTRAAFWKAKIEGNRARDRRVNRLLRKNDWTVIRIWEHELAKRNLPRLLRRLSVLQD
jgi:DNA mismatch endonuclease (patch repair protein)